MNLEDQALRLTIALYRVTEQFPKDEVLKQTLRKQGLKILKLIIKLADENGEKITKNVKIIQAYLQLAKKLQVTKTINLEVLQREYGHLTEYFLSQEPTRAVQQKSTVSDSNSSLKSTELNDRQKTIITYLKERKQAKVGDLQNIFKNLSSKTIQRDLHDLVARNILTRDGDKRWTTYYLTDKVR